MPYQMMAFAVTGVDMEMCSALPVRSLGLDGGRCTVADMLHKDALLCHAGC
jgi:hypothetical protein